MQYTIDQIVEWHLEFCQSRFDHLAPLGISFPARRDLQSHRRLFDQYDFSAHLSNALEHITINALQAMSGMNTSPREIAATWKPQYGAITYRTRDLPDSTIFEVEDEGSGINPQEIRRAAQERGIIPPASEEEVLDLIFQSRVTTKVTRSDSGRGQGLHLSRQDLREGWLIMVRGTAYNSGEQLIKLGEYDKNRTGTIIRINFPAEPQYSKGA